jgi:hypothetical protein
MKGVFGILLGAVLLAGTITAWGQGTLVVDQQTGQSLAGVGVVIQTNTPVGQSFTPSLSSVGYVALMLADNTPDTGSATVYVNVRSGSITGTVLGTTTSVSLPAAAGGYQMVDFYFPITISLSPGTTYYFDVNQSSGTPWLVNIYGYEYAGGTAFLKGAALTQDDLWFQEGVVVPEPSVAWLVLVGGGIFFSARRWPKSPES